MTNTRTCIIRWREVEAMTGLCRTEAYRRMKLGLFPKTVSLGSAAATSVKRAPVGWVLSEIEAWVQERIAARTEPREQPQRPAA